MTDNRKENENEKKEAGEADGGYCRRGEYIKEGRKEGRKSGGRSENESVCEREKREGVEETKREEKKVE